MVFRILYRFLLFVQAIELLRQSGNTVILLIEKIQNMAEVPALDVVSDLPSNIWSNFLVNEFIFLILVILSVKTLSKFRCLYMPLLPPWTQDVNWTYIGCTQDFWRFSTKFYERFSCKPYVRSLNLSCMLHWIMLTSTIWSIFRE